MDLILLLNGDLAREYSAAIQYLQHAAVLDGIFSAFSAELRTHADEEIGHAKKLNEHINYLGGVPTISVAQIFTASDPIPMLQQDLNGEVEAIAQYKERIDQALAKRDYGTMKILLDILEEEESHANELKAMLG